jgi:superfamily II DNA or RNA helicase
MSERQLRPYQLEAVEAVYKQWADGVDRTAVVLPTGTGKTDVISAIAVREARAGPRVLAVAHRDELLDQITERIRMHDPAVPIGRVQGKTNQTTRKITVASTPTLWGEKRRGRMAPPDVVLYDEVHHAPSPKSVEVLRWAGCYGRPERSDIARLCGFTATPVRGDKRGMGDVLQDVAFKRDIAWAVDQGFLVRPRGKVVVADHMDLNKAKVRAGDYTDAELGDMVEQDVDQIVAAWLEHARERLTVAFTPNVASAHALTEAFRSAGIAAETVIGTTPRTERKLIYKRLAVGEVRVLVSVMVTTEGWDCPPVSCVLQCRPTRLPGLYTQMVGRVLRPSVETGKTDALVLDVVGASRGQKLVTLVDLSVSSEYDASAIDDLPCEVCGAWPSRAAAVRQGEPDAPVCECNPEGPAKPRRRLDGPATYEDLDLLLTSSPFTWQQTYAGTPFLPAGERRMAVLWLDRKSDLYIVGHCAMKGLAPDGVRLAEGLTLDQARRVAEEWATTYAAGQLNTSSRKAGWRKGGSPTFEQMKWARELRIAGAENMTKAELSDAISVGRASRMIDPRG